VKKTLGIMVAGAVLFSVCILHAEEKVSADRVVDIAASRVSYDIKTAEDEDIILTVDYTSERPNPELENMDIVPQGAVKDGTRVFRIQTKEGSPIEIQYVYENGERVGMKISAEPSDPSSDAEYSQVLSVESKGGYIIKFTFIWQGKELKEVRIEPLINPFSAPE